MNRFFAWCTGLLALVYFSAAAQPSTLPALHLPVDSLSGAISYQAVVPVPGASKQELYRRAREWFVDNFKAYQQVVSVEDTLGGEIVGTYHSTQDKYFLLTYTPWEYWRTLKVYVKNGRYRYELTNFGVRDVRYGRGIYPLHPQSPADLRRFGPEANQQAQHDVAALLRAMSTPGGGKKQDW